MNKRGFTFGLGCGLLIACVFVYFIYGAQKNEWRKEKESLNAEIESLTAVTETAGPTETAAPTPTEPAVPANTPAPATQELAQTETASETENPAEPAAIDDQPTEPADGAVSEPSEPSGDQAEVTETSGSAEAAAVTDDTTAAGTTEDAQPSGSETQTDKILLYIPEGSGASEICDILYANGVIDDSGAYLNYLRDNGLTEKLQYGNYRFDRDMSYADITAIIMI